MTLKTFQDCIRCRNLTECDAHITGGRYDHMKGSDPCEIIYDKKTPETNNEDAAAG